MKFICSFCKSESDRPTGEVNRAKKRGLHLYCDRVCAGLGRRKHKSVQQKKEEKRLYDMGYRKDNKKKLKKKKAAYHKENYDPEKAAIIRKSRMPYHVEYCQRPEYREWKKDYDRKYRAKKDYGEFWECFLLTQDIRQAALAQMTDYEIRFNKGTLNKRLQRKRDHARQQSEIIRAELERGPMGYLTGCQRRPHERPES